MADEYARGKRDGLRLALAVLSAEEGKWSALLGEDASWRTRTAREIRHKALQVAQTRIRTMLNRLTPRGGDGMDPEVASAVEKAGL
jgi:hypothetical protein